MTGWRLRRWRAAGRRSTDVKTGKQVATFDIDGAGVGMNCFAAGGTLAIALTTAGQEAGKATPYRLTAFEWRSGRKVWERTDSSFSRVLAVPIDTR